MPRRQAGSGRRRTGERRLRASVRGFDAGTFFFSAFDARTGCVCSLRAWPRYYDLTCEIILLGRAGLLWLSKIYGPPPVMGPWRRPTSPYIRAGPETRCVWFRNQVDRNVMVPFLSEQVGSIPMYWLRNLMKWNSSVLLFGWKDGMKCIWFSYPFTQKC